MQQDLLIDFQIAINSIYIVDYIRKLCQYLSRY